MITIYHNPRCLKSRVSLQLLLIRTAVVRLPEKILELVND